MSAVPQEFVQEDKYSGGFVAWYTPEANLNTKATWVNITGNLLNANETSFLFQPGGLTVDPNSPSTVYLPMQCGVNPIQCRNLYKASPLGANTKWVAADGSAKGTAPINTQVYKVLVDRTDSTGRHLLAGTASGLYMNSNSGADWAPYNNGVVPPVPVLDVEQNPVGDVFVATHGAGAYELPAAPHFVGYRNLAESETQSATATATVSPPPGAVQGDVFIAALTAGGPQGRPSASGWSLLPFANHNGAGAVPSSVGTWDGGRGLAC